MVLAAGIDLSTKPRKCGIVVIDTASALVASGRKTVVASYFRGAKIPDVLAGCEDQDIIEALVAKARHGNGGVRVAVDVPLSWPAGGEAGKRWSDLLSSTAPAEIAEDLMRRACDVYWSGVLESLEPPDGRRRPSVFHVAQQLIAATTREWRRIEAVTACGSAGTDVDRSGMTSDVVEGWPGLTLALWSGEADDGDLWPSGYKSNKPDKEAARDRRRRMATSIVGELRLDPCGLADAAAESADVLDALVMSVVALGLEDLEAGTRPLPRHEDHDLPDDLEAARRAPVEGWQHPGPAWDDLSGLMPRHVVARPG